MKRALAKLNIPAPLPKPRNKSLTMFTDLGCGIHEQEDCMDVAADFVDLAKFATSMCATLPEDIVKAKIASYQKYGVEPFTGGVQFEKALYDNGLGICDYYFTEMKNLGLNVVEISDNYIDLRLESKCKIIEKGTKDFGLKMLAEAGDEVEDTPLELLIEDCNASLEAGAWKVLLEAAELIDKKTNELRVEYIDAIGEAVGLENIIFELPWVWLENVHWHQTFSTMALMIKKLGPHANLGNIEMSMLVYCEMIRNGAGAKLAKDRTI